MWPPIFFCNSHALVGESRGLENIFCNLYSPFFFARQKKRIFLFFLWGDPVQNRPQNPAPAGCLFSTRKSRSEVPERGDFGEENCLGKGGADREKKEKRMHKKRWVYEINSSQEFFLNCKHFGVDGKDRVHHQELLGRPLRNKYLRKLEKAVAVSGVFAPGVLEESSGKIAGSRLAGKIFPNREMLQILGFQAPGKANLPGTLGPHCSGPCPHLPGGVFFEIDSSSLLEFF